MKFIRRHWQGKYRLSISVGVIFIGLNVLVHSAQPQLIKPFYDRPELYVTLSILYILLSCFVLFPWQLRGVLRALDHHFLRFDNSLVLYGVQAIVVSGLIIVLSTVLGTAQSLVYYWEKKTFEANNQARSYEISLSADGKVMQLSGVLDFGITDSATELLSSNPGVAAVILDSVGGQIYEGRGLAKLFQRHALTTYTFKQCSSSCTTAFIGGAQRYLGPAAKLGFHQYAIDEQRRRQISASYDLQEEQLKDIEFFKSQGIKAPFLERVFETPQHSMWYPESKVLIEAGVVKAVVDSPI